ncbi:hypothetical protein [Marinobacter salsuginis]|uniref:hypothetical protein n=1 Tax=Marinobacter salsuginis TaxID=418719 RepID=UPI00273D2747|nr:hypothetical protein [Marinobacter salsuginis]
MSTFRHAGVTARSLTPCQRKTERRFRIATDFRVTQMLKHPSPCEFHSLAEYYHAALLEGDPTVERFVPQPFLLEIGRQRRRYVPDVYVVRDGQVEILELRPDARFDEHQRTAVQAFCQNHRMRFKVISNQAVLSRRTLADNWLLIIQILLSHRSLDTTHWEMVLLDEISRRGEIRLGDVVIRNHREASRTQEIALLRLLHRGLLMADLTDRRLAYDTEVRLCD